MRSGPSATRRDWGVRALLSGTDRAQMERVVQTVVKIETATEPRFQDLFVAAMAFPHATVATPHLASLVDLPSRGADGGGAGRRRSWH